ncbi:DUF2294 domain-containing protein [Haloplasma contractile]|uniref:Na+-translocating membrane potential-generating system MpsC domain-containing protein n=1 Tax=Haloplasma contractile SSD-17B TaxID=1033810 RepID=F7PVW9_9MOLU|nr:DUF2294 domain-containing protein [Haloplasma contractile]ERJ12707.1 hypothetical protein HLPCO_001047 [Haloplasma contractile SSD-17B]
MTKGQMESEISKQITQWEKDYLGRGPTSVKTDILRDMIIVVLQGILTPADHKIAETKEGLLSIKKYRADLVESGREQLFGTVKEITGEDVLAFHTDISTKTGERIMVFKLKTNFEQTFK